MTNLRNGKEHRWGERIMVDIPVQLSAEKVAGIRGHIRNLSLSGALLRVDTPLDLNALIEVSIDVLVPSPHTALVAARVSRKRNDDVGIEWCAFAPTVVKELLRANSIPLPF